MTALDHPDRTAKRPLKLVTSDIANADDSNPAEIELTFADPNPDLQYFLPGDVVSSDGAIYRDFVNNTYTSNQTFDGDSTGIDWQAPVADGFDGDTNTNVIGFNAELFLDLRQSAQSANCCIYG